MIFLDTLHLGRAHVIGTAVLDLGDGNLALVDCGPANVFLALVEGLKRLRLDPSRVQHLLLTHIHLDHAGGAWRWQQEFGTPISVHPRGTAHLIDPQRLIASATRIYGDRMTELWGEIKPVPDSAVHATSDGERLQLGRCSIEVLETPGHAQHHNAYHLPSEDLIFTGDIAGVKIDAGPILPPFPPPDIDVESWLSSIDRLEALRPDAFWLTHFGEVRDTTAHLTELRQRILRWAEWMRTELRDKRTEPELIRSFQNLTAAELAKAPISDAIREAYEQADPATMSVAGLRRYWEKFHPELLSAD